MIVFTNSWLHVGQRKDDWTDVWAQPILEDMDDDGAPIFKLQKAPKGEPTPREPMEGEVTWTPTFDPKNCLSSVKAERERLQRQIIYDAWRYCNAKNPREVEELEDSLANPNHRKWQAWFTHAKKWKRNKMRGRGRRRNERESVIREAGIDPSSVELNSDSEDSAYGTEAEGQMAREKGDRENASGRNAANTGRDRTDMDPPPQRGQRPAPNKRRGAAAAAGSGDSSKKARITKRPTAKGRGKAPVRRSSSPAASDVDEFELPTMSGGLGDQIDQPNGMDYLFGAQRAATPTVLDGRTSDNLTTDNHSRTTINLVDDDDDVDEEDFDTRSPDNAPPPAFTAPAANPSSSNTTGAAYPTPRSKSSSGSPGLGNGLIGGTGSTDRTLGENRPVPSPSRHRTASLFGAGSTAFGNQREGSVLNDDDRDNGGVEEEEAVQRAIRASMPPEKPRPATVESVEDLDD